MKNLWKYASLFLAVLLAGILFVHFQTQSKLQDKIIELQEQAPIVVEKYVHDTIQFDSIQIKWRTKYDTTEFVVRDTFSIADTIFIVQTEKCPIDTFYATETYKDSIIETTINIQGRGVYQNTFLDSISLDYTIKQIEKKRKCNWWRRIFCGCE